jgi:hypothetical protein
MDFTQFVSMLEERGLLFTRADLAALAENVYVSPTAKRWFLELVKGILRRYKLDVPVRQSDLAAEPLSLT